MQGRQPYIEICRHSVKMRPEYKKIHLWCQIYTQKGKAIPVHTMKA